MRTNKTPDPVGSVFSAVVCVTEEVSTDEIRIDKVKSRRKRGKDME